MSVRWCLRNLLLLGLLTLQGWAAAQLPEDPARWLSAYQTLFTRLLSQEDKVAARIEAERVLEDVYSRYGNESIETTTAMAALAEALEVVGERDQSLQLWMRLLQIFERVAPDHPITADLLNGIAQKYSRLNEHDQALKLFLRALQIREKTEGPDHRSIAQALNDVATTYFALGKYDLALPLQRRAVPIYESAFGPDHPDMAMALSNLASTHAALAQHDLALPLQRRALQILEKALGPDHWETATALRSLATIHVNLGQYDLALPLHLRALRILERALGPDHPHTAAALTSLAMTYGALAQDDLALPLQVRALQIYEKVFGPDHQDTARAMNNLAGIHFELAQYDLALPLHLRALQIREKALGPDHPDTATALSYVAVTHGALARHDLALPLQLRALQIYEKSLGPDHLDTARALSSLAHIHAALAQHDLALPLQRRALEIHEKVLGHDHPDTARALSNLAGTYLELAQHDLALPLQHRALQSRERALGPDHPTTATSLNNLAGTHATLAQHDRALPLQIRVLKIYEKARGHDHPDTAKALNNLAATHFAMGRFELALPLQFRAVEILERTLGPAHPNTAMALNNVAQTHAALAQHDLALPLQRRALQMLEMALGPDHPRTALVLSTIAITLRGAKLGELTVTFLKLSVNAYQANRERVSRIGTEELRAYTASVSGTYQALARALTDQGRLAEAQVVLDMLKEDEQFDFIRRSGGADPRRTRIGYTATEERWMRRYREIADRLAALGREEQALQKQARVGLTDEQKARQQALAADLKVAQAAFQSFLDQMRQEFAAKGPARAVEFAESSIKALAELQGLLKSLGDGVVLLQVYLTDEQVNFLLTTPGVQLARSTRIGQKDLNRQVLEYQRLLRDRKSDPLPAAQALYRLLLAPVAKDLEQAGAKTVMLSLDGVLRYLPFGALHDGQRYVLQRWDLPVYTSVVRERLREANTPQWQAAGLGVTRKLGDFDPLPAVRAEMSSIIRSGSSGVLPGEVHLDEAFTAQRLQDVSRRRFPVVHVASHFRFSPGTEINSFLLLGDGNRLTLGDIRTQNYRFDDVDLLTLSACETGLGGGRDERGQEIEGFGVIAQQQGAKAVLATLWRVADNSTATLMGDMYRRRMEAGLTKIEALRQAQIAMAAKPETAHPFYWAPFILMGNWK